MISIRSGERAELLDIDYSYLLVTKGRSPQTQERPNHLLPLGLIPKDHGLPALRAKVELMLVCHALAFTPHAPSAMDVIKGISTRWMVNAMADLWLSEVRLAPNGTLGTPEEETIEWILLFDPFDRLPERWQGPADAVIPKSTPVTIRAQNALSKFEVEVIVTPESLKTFLGYNRQNRT